MRMSLPDKIGGQYGADYGPWGRCKAFLLHMLAESPHLLRLDGWALVDSFGGLARTARANSPPSQIDTDAQGLRMLCRCRHGTSAPVWAAEDHLAGQRGAGYSCGRQERAGLCKGGT